MLLNLTETQSLLAPRFFLRGRFLGSDERLLSSFTSALLSTEFTSLNYTSTSVSASKLELCVVLLSNLSTPVSPPNSCRALTGLLTTTTPSLGVGVNEASSGLLVILLGALTGSALLGASLIALGVLQVRRCRAQRAGAKSDPSANLSPVQRSANSDANESQRQRMSAPCAICASRSLPRDALAQSAAFCDHSDRQPPARALSQPAIAGFAAAGCINTEPSASSKESLACAMNGRPFMSLSSPALPTLTEADMARARTPLPRRPRRVSQLHSAARRSRAASGTIRRESTRPATVYTEVSEYEQLPGEPPATIRNTSSSIAPTSVCLSVSVPAPSSGPRMISAPQVHYATRNEHVAFRMSAQKGILENNGRSSREMGSPVSRAAGAFWNTAFEQSVTAAVSPSAAAHHSVCCSAPPTPATLETQLYTDLDALSGGMNAAKVAKREATDGVSGCRGALVATVTHVNNNNDNNLRVDGGTAEALLTEYRVPPPHMSSTPLSSRAAERTTDENCTLNVYLTPPSRVRTNSALSFAPPPLPAPNARDYANMQFVNQRRLPSNYENEGKLNAMRLQLHRHNSSFYDPQV